MRFHGMRRAAVAAALAIPVGLVSASALASESLEVKPGQTAYIDGTVRYKSLAVRGGGTLVVRSVASGGTGTLTIKAESVVVDEGGKIDATGAGFPGTAADGSAPACCMAAAGVAGPSGNDAPGGGGGNGGKGAAGCPNGGKGGEAYINLENGYPGAAGGAASFEPAIADSPNVGGAGGGSITILAASVTIDGEILANGANGIAYGGAGSGGGAGGVIRIDAHEVLGAGLLSARGGDGATAYSGIGGGGGGGVIQISSATALPMDNALPARNADGGLTGTGTCSAGEAGIDDVNVDPAKPCTDADGDGHGAVACGGDDCDDADPSVFGGSAPATEVCDGQDNDCNGSTDDDLVADACPEGQSCQDGACQSEGTGGAGGGSGDPPPDYVDYRGGCEVSPMRAAHVNGAIFFGAALVGFLATLGRRRKRR